MLTKLDLCAYFFQKTAYRRDFDEAKCIHFLVKDDELLKKYNKVKNSIKKI